MHWELGDRPGSLFTPDADQSQLQPGAQHFLPGWKPRGYSALSIFPAFMITTSFPVSAAWISTKHHTRRKAIILRTSAGTRLILRANISSTLM